MIADLVAILLVLCLFTLIVRGRAGVCWTFTAHLATAIIGNRLVTWWPDEFHTYGFWLLKESVYAGLTVAILLELTFHALSGFRAARQLVLALVAGTALATTSSMLAAGERIPNVISVVQAGTVWAFAALLCVALWFHLPMHPLRLAVVFGLTLYLGVYGAMLGLVRYLSPAALPYLSALDGAAYAATLLLWLRAAAWPYEGEPVWPVPSWRRRREA